jgi:DNA-binding MarR family transcriptional regulator
MNTQAPDPSLGILIADLSRLLRRDFDDRVTGLGLTQAQWRTLARLARAEGCRQADLAAIMEVAPITLARFIDRLEQSKLVERRRHPTDRRAVQLYLTARGRRLSGKMRSIAACTYDRALHGVAPADRRRLIQVLARMRDNLSDPATSPGRVVRPSRHGR